MPISYLTQGIWPWGQLSRDAPPGAHGALLVARALHRAMIAKDLKNTRDLGKLVKVAHSTIARILNGEVLPDIGTLARLEHSLGAPLWPSPAAVRACTAVAPEDDLG